MKVTHLSTLFISIWLLPIVLLITITAVTMHFDYALGSSIHTPEELHRHISDTCAAKHYNASQHNTFFVDVYTNEAVYDAEYNIGGTLVSISSIRTGGLFTVTASYIITASVITPALCIIGLPLTRGTYTTHETCKLNMKALVDQVIIRPSFAVTIVAWPKYHALLIGHISNNNALYDVTSDIHTASVAISVSNVWLYTYSATKVATVRSASYFIIAIRSFLPLHASIHIICITLVHICAYRYVVNSISMCVHNSK